MWYEILPTFGIILAAITVPSLVMPPIYKLVLGKPYRRVVHDHAQIDVYFRDKVVGGGSVYNLKGLESIQPEKKGCIPSEKGCIQPEN